MKTTEKSIMVVDDDVYNVFLLQQIIRLMDEKIKIFQAYSGIEAIETLKNQPNIGIIIMDINFKEGEMDGIQATRIIRNLDDKYQFNFESKIIIIGLTAADRSNDLKNRCKDVGMNQLLWKPVERESILYWVRQYLA